ncbi:segregation/condensation protein A [Haloterrigena sp. SYSU A558-1]|uniref:Segregation/condensation protein A n=1 Tax=Haloterrigena gelatinilytica TaxID=2741724 RepID=A0A8J8GNL4_9EURY|nr:ScpA family protein [Haloterrigena gelatinilytica]NUB91584.1 segregation/condensation protein A [Haloterrigena gelatinilytica]NUC72679.1 segregation/condensation protein A [Haloterrigena gelatinilytica]
MSAEGASRESRSDSEKPSGERNGPRGGDRDEFYTDGGRDDIPLNITGHEEREPPDGGSEQSSGDRREPGDRERPGDSSADAAPRDADAESSVLEFSEDETTDAEVDADADEAGDDADDEVEPVELLVQLAKDGEIDPWDIDVVQVTDKFLEALDDADLRTSGRALFYASVLLRMKSDELFATDEPEEEELPPWEAPFADEGAMEPEGDDGGAHPPGFDPVESLEAEMERRLERKQARGKPETLDELVRELRSAERDSWWKESRSYDTSESPQGYDRGVQELDYHANDDFRVDDEPTSDDVTHTTHEEDIEAVIDDVEAELEAQYEAGREEVLYAEIEAVGGTRVMTYLALLFLAHRGRIRLEQDELFGDLWIQNAAAETDANEAIAD